MYNFDLGYVQGMSDLLAPLLELFNNEVDAFWCFVGFMDRVVSIILVHLLPGFGVVLKHINFYRVLISTKTKKA